jgi:hypothetical protein
MDDSTLKSTVKTRLTSAVLMVAVTTALCWFVVHSSSSVLAGAVQWTLGILYGMCLIAMLIWAFGGDRRDGGYSVALVIISAVAVFSTGPIYHRWEKISYGRLSSAIAALGPHAANFDSLKAITENPDQYGAAAPAAEWIHEWSDSLSRHWTEFQATCKTLPYDSVVHWSENRNPERYQVLRAILRKKLSQLEDYQGIFAADAEQAAKKLKECDIPPRLRKQVETSLDDFGWSEYSTRYVKSLRKVAQSLDGYLEMQKLGQPPSQGDDEFRYIMRQVNNMIGFEAQSFNRIQEARAALESFLQRPPPVYRLGIALSDSTQE